MGVVTTAYSILPKTMRKIRADNDYLEHVFEGGDLNREIESYDFDTIIEPWISILREMGYKKTAENIDFERYFSDSQNCLDYDGYDIWIISPSKVKAMAEEIQNAVFTELKNKGLAYGITDRRGKILLESEYEGYFGDIENLKKFFKKTADEGNYLLFSEA